MNHGSLITVRYIGSISEMLSNHLKMTDEDWHLYINPCELNTYVSLSTGYSAFGLMYLYKPPSLTHMEYSPLQHLSRSLDDFMKIMKKRFDVMRKIVLDHDQP